MGTRNSRPKRDEGGGPACAKPSAGRKYAQSDAAHHHRYSPSDYDAATVATQRSEAERQQVGNYFSNDYKRQLSQRKAAERGRQARRNSMPSSTRNGESGLTSYLSKDDIARVTPSLDDGAATPVAGARRSTAPSIISETSVRTVAHKPILRPQQSSAKPERRKPASGAPRRLQWSREAAASRDARRYDGAYMFAPIYVHQTPHAAPSHGYDDWCGDGGCDGGTSFF